MAAVPYKISIKAVGSDGWTNDYACTVSDVNGEFYIWEDGQNVVTMPTTHGTIAFVDIVLSAAGTDTSKATIYVNGKTIGRTILNAANLGTNFSRQFTYASPLKLAPGANIRFTQNT